MYPHSGPAGGGLLRLHSTFRHDLKIYSSDEGRVQMSAAAFTKGLLDLEGDSLAPILVSLVTKDQGLLDTFGKGTNHEIQRAKTAVYDFLTKDIRGESPSKHGVSSSDDGSSFWQFPHVPSPTNKPLASPTRNVPEENYEEWLQPFAGTPHPSSLLRELRKELRILCGQLEERCRLKRKGGEAVAGELLRPGNDETIELVHSRWSKLKEEFYHNRKSRYEISKIPDIYDMVKYDALHNEHLNLQGLKDLYATAKTIAEIVIPNEYGVSPLAKLRIGSKICGPLLGKIMRDFTYAREESEDTRAVSPLLDTRKPRKSTSLTSTSLEDARMRSLLFRAPAGSGVVGHRQSPLAISSGPAPPQPLHSAGNVPAEQVGADPEKVNSEVDHDELPQNRLNASYASVQSPHRHVRTRLYFTSESHIHALTNVLRNCHLDGTGDGDDKEPLLTGGGRALLDMSTELDYLSHIVFRMYERKGLPEGDPRRFRVEIQFSPGAATDPFSGDAQSLAPRPRSDSEAMLPPDSLPELPSRVLPVAGRSMLSAEPDQSSDVAPELSECLTLERTERLLSKFAINPKATDARRASVGPGNDFLLSSWVDSPTGASNPVTPTARPGAPVSSLTLAFANVEGPSKAA